MMHVLSLIKPSILVALISLAALDFAHAQEADARLGATVVALFVQATNFNISSKPRYALSRQILQLATPIVVPNLFSDNAVFKKSLQSLDNVPIVDASSVRLGDIATTVALGGLKGTLTLARPIASKEDDSSNDEAKKILFKDNGLPTEGYKQYLSYEDRYNKKIDSLKKEDDPELQQQLRAELAVLEREWEAIGDRSTFAAAVKQYEQSNPGTDQAFVEKWLKGLEPVNVATLLDTAIESRNWIRISQSRSIGSNIHLSSETGSAEISGVKRVSFDATVVWLDRKYLADGFLLDRGWKTSSNRPVSIGNGATTTNSLLPHVVVGLLIIKNLELEVESGLDRNAKAILGANTAMQIDGITVDPSDGKPVISQKQMIGLPGLLIVGAVVDGLKQIPDPDPERRWPD